MSLSPAHEDERGLHDPGTGGLIHKSHRGCDLSVSPSEPTSSPAYQSLQAVSALDETVPISCHVLTMKAYHQMFRPEGMHLPPHIQGSRELQPAATSHMPRILPSDADSRNDFSRTLPSQPCPTASPKSLEDRDKPHLWG